ncbi:helix-turn-helix domain-containing protein [Parafrankia sp. Ea1.12]|uniref:helix-turn-helix domain-containing protein n=1 Tax=unclassified Parafrankia TaxID=2994368 RepID=UPI000DD34022|nr:helix-turn-helix transcriptional regulator [Parafrankia sp. Ea1.12]TCJ33142.1 XRE family transcriptional regulator [Parafrankia sp. BMG5.11]
MIAGTAAAGGGVAPTRAAGYRPESAGPPVEPVAPPLRRLIGGVLRRLRQAQGRTLRDVAEAAQVSMPYLSEVERGRKEASSEVLAAICRALNIRLVDLLAEVMAELVRYEPLPLTTATPTASPGARGATAAADLDVVAGTPATAHVMTVHPSATLGSVALGGPDAGVGAVRASVSVHLVVARRGRAVRRVPGHRRRGATIRLAARPGPGRPPAHPGALVRRRSCWAVQSVGALPTTHGAVGTTAHAQRVR